VTGGTRPRPRTPADALAMLLAGNERFVSGSPVHPHQDTRYRTELVTAQNPFAVVFGCSDSRLAAEIIFDHGLGDLLVVRTAGHIVGAEVLASITFGVCVLRAPLVVVLGHDSCGAVRATLNALNGAPPAEPELRPIVDRVAPSARYAKAHRITAPDDVADIHIGRTVDELTASSGAIAGRVATGRCAVVGMSYRLARGRVTVLEPGLPGR